MNFLTEADDDDDFLSPQQGKTQKSKQTARGGLLSLFNNSNNSSPRVAEKDSKNDFIYKAPKKNSGLSQDTGAKENAETSSNPKMQNQVFVVDVYLFDPTSGGGKAGYKPLGKSGVTVINKPIGAQNKEPNSSADTIVQKVLILYRSKQETLAAAPIVGDKFIFDIQNETYGCFYTLGKYQQKVTWSLCFKDQEELMNFARVVALSKLSTINATEQRIKEEQNDPIYTQVLAKPQTSNDSTSFGKAQFGQFSIDIWKIHDTEFNYSSRIQEGEIQEVSGNEDVDTPFWTKLMFGANVGEIRVIMMPHDGRYAKKSKKEIPSSHFVAFEIKLMKILKPNSTKKQPSTENEIKDVGHKDFNETKIKVTTETTNENVKTSLQSRLTNETVVTEADHNEARNGVSEDFLGKLNQVIQPTDHEKNRIMKSSNNVEPIASTSRLDLILTEQRIHHLSILKLDEKLDKILAQNINNGPPLRDESQVSNSNENMDALMSLQSQLKLVNADNDKLRAQLEEANSKFTRLEALLQTTEAELSAVKEDLVNLSNSKSDDVSKVFDPEATNKMVKKVLNKIFKQMKGNLANDDDSNKSYSSKDIIDVLAQQFRDVAQLLDSSSDQTKLESQ